MLGSPLEIFAGWFFMVFLTWIVIFGGVGFFLSRTRDQNPFIGAVLGATAGVIGWALVFPIAAATRSIRKRREAGSKPPMRIPVPALPPPRPFGQEQPDLSTLPPPVALDELPPPSPAPAIPIPSERDVDSEIRLKRKREEG